MPKIDPRKMELGSAAGKSHGIVGDCAKTEIKSERANLKSAEPS